MVEYIMEHVRCSYEYVAQVDSRRTVASFLTNHSIGKKSVLLKKTREKKKTNSFTSSKRRIVFFQRLF